jgi:parallel beta-helix repeat protein
MERGPGGREPRSVLLDPGFYGVSRPVRIVGGITVQADLGAGGRAWFLPTPPEGEELETLFLVDGTHDTHLAGLGLNGRATRAAHGLRVRCGTGLHVERCHFEDFRREDGAAIAVEGESEDRPVRGIVIQDCHLLHGGVGVRLGRHVTDLLVTSNRFDEIDGPALDLDPGDHWTSLGLIFVKNRIRGTRPRRTVPFVRVMPGAEGLRIAENTFEGPADPGPEARWTGVEIRGGGRVSVRRIELILNRLLGIPGSGIDATACGPGLLLAGNRLTACGSEGDGSIHLHGCAGALVEDNEIDEPGGAGIRASSCRHVRLNGNGILGHLDRTMPRGGGIGIRIEGEETRRLRLTDNKVTGMRIAGVRVDDGIGVRIVGNEVEDSGEGIHVARARNLLLVGNDCRDNGGGGLRVDRDVRRGLVALNYAILNGPIDLEVLGDRIRCHSNKVDREGRLPGREG